MGCPWRVTPRDLVVPHRNGVGVRSDFGTRVTDKEGTLRRIWNKRVKDSTKEQEIITFELFQTWIKY